jgi:hypothetical protein
VYILSAALALGWQQRPRPASPKPATELERAAEEFKTLSRELGLRADSPVRAQRARSARTGWHGRLYENFRNNALDAVPHEIRQRGGQQNFLRRNQYGFNVAGPLAIPKIYDGSRTTFLSVSFEGVREGIARSYLRTIAIPEERAGDFSRTVDPAGNPLPVYDPQSTRLNPAYDPSRPVAMSNLQYVRDPFPANRIPAGRLDPVAMRAVAEYPLPNADAGPFFRNNFFVVSPETNTANGMIFKVDHTFGERHRASFNGSFTNGFAGAPRLFATIADPGNNDRDFSARRGTLDWTFTKTPRTVNTLTLDARSDRSESFREGQDGALGALGLRGPLGLAFPSFRFSSYLGMGRNNPVAVNSHNYYFLTNSFALRAGKHNLRFITQARRYQVNALLPQYPAGNFQFSPSITSLPGINNTGHVFASFLLGNVDFAEATLVENPSYWRATMWSATVRDSYEVSKSLNLTASFTLDGQGPRTEKYDRFATVDLTQPNPANGLPGALVFAGRNGRGRGFQPWRVRPETSLSIAWNPRGNARSVVRASYSLRFSNIPIYTTQWSTQGFVGTPTFVSQNIQLQPALRLRDGMPPLPHPLPDLRPDAANFTVADLVDPSGTQPLFQSAGLSYEREIPRQVILSVNLGHARGQRLFISNSNFNPNAIPLDNLRHRDALNSEAFRRTLRPYPHYQRFDVYNSWPLGNYKRNAIAVRAEKRSSAGLTLNLSYEWSKQMDDYSGPYGVQDFYNRRNEWSLTSSNNPHRVALSYAYELPFGSKKSLLAYSDWRRYMVDGWSVSGISSLQSGEPLALRPQFNNTGSVVEALRVNLVPGVDPRVANRGPELWFNPAAFAQPADFTTGDGPRTHPQLLGPGNQNHDLSVTKRIALTTESALEVSATGFNFINTANWTDPDVVIGPASSPNVNAGKIIGSRGNRVIQLGMRFSF